MRTAHKEPPRARSPPIVEFVNALTLVLVAIVVALLIALVASQRQVRASKRVPRQTTSIVTSGPQLVDAAARLAPIGIAIVDETGRRVFENDSLPTYAAATGEAALVALRLRNLLGAAGDSDERLEQEVDLHGSVPRTIRLQAVPLFNGAVRLGTAAFIEDVTTRSQIDSMRSDFIANASHELKTPLGAMRLLAEALVATNDPAVANDLAERIQTEAERINRLVEDILDLAILESGPIEADEVDLCEVLDDALTQTRTFSNAVAIPIRHRCQPVMVSGDHRRLVSAIANLIENALSYTAVKGTEQPQPIAVRVWSEGGEAVIEVQDHGIGIPDRHQDRIFERFYRIDRGRSRASGGTGLGLAIVRHIAENHDGTVSVQSVSGEGSTFKILLPAVEV